MDGWVGLGGGIGMSVGRSPVRPSFTRPTALDPKSGNQERKGTLTASPAIHWLVSASSTSTWISCGSYFDLSV